jgi:hypothetical protein
MLKNVGTIDRIVRIGLALALAGIALFAHPSGAIFLWAGAIVLVVTGGGGYCPLYGACRLSTRREKVTKGVSQ